MQWRRPTDQVLLRLAVAYLIAILLMVILAIFVSAWWVLAATAVFIGYGAFMLRVTLADKTAYPNDRLPWRLEVLFHGFTDQKGLGITFVAWFIGLLALLVMMIALA